MPQRNGWGFFVGARQDDPGASKPDRADEVGTTPSEFLRMVVTMTMKMSPKIQNAVKIEIDEKALTDDENETKEGMVTGRENDEANSDNQLQQ